MIEVVVAYIVFLEEAPILLELLISLGDNGRRYTSELVTGFFLRVFRNLRMTIADRNVTRKNARKDL